MNDIEMCIHYGYDLGKARPTCGRGHKASLKCHSIRKDCTDYSLSSVGWTVMREWKKEGEND